MDTTFSPIESVTLEAPDPAAAEAFYDAAFGLGDRLGVRAADDAPTSGFRGFTMSLVVARPATVDAFVDAALDHGATALKATNTSLWGYGGVVRAPDGAIWKVATSAKKDKGPATREVDDVVLLLGVADVKASRRFYVEQGFTVAKSFGSRYVEFEAAGAPVKLALYGRKALAKDAGVPQDGSGSHRLVIDGDAGSFSDPDGFEWDTAAITGARSAASSAMAGRS
jgi:predicted lactoylglutathione lyase